MAQCKQTPQEFIQSAFSPSVAVLCSADAEIVCQKNNLSFEEMVQPFCRLNTEAVLKVVSTQPISVRNLRVVIKDLNTQVPQPPMIKKLLNDSVSSCTSGHEGGRSSMIKRAIYELHLPASLPWFEAYRECFIDVAYPSDHEFTKHFLACLFVVSTSHPNPNAELVRLSQQQHQMQHQSHGKITKWFSPNTLKGYVLVHDISDGDQTNAEAAFQSMKSAFPGSFCHLLQINSQPLDTTQPQSNSVNQPPDPWSRFLVRKIEQMDGSDYDNSPRTPQEDNIFPTKLSEGDTELEINHMAEEATEVTEDVTIQQQNVDFSHPLSPDNSSSSLNKFVPEKPVKGIKIESVNEKDAPLANFVNNGKITWPPETPQTRPHGLCLTVSDLDRIRIFIHEFVVRGLIPHVERNIKILNEAMATSRKKFHRSFLNVTKWLAGNKPGYQGQHTPANTVVYSPEASELQVRKLGDLAFMFQHYELSYQAYHAAKQDFNTDQAWLYHAGALEMAALATFMLGSNSQRQYPFHYMENAINTYLNVCKLPHFATRCTLLSAECLKSKHLFGEAAMQFIKMTSEDSDLRSALLLEQAAYCFIAMPSTMIRKYAFHMVLAGHRFSKAGQRKHALRAYKQAHQIYNCRNWSLAEDHINFTIGRQSSNLKQLDQALQAFQNLLKENSQQTSTQQMSYLKEYLFTCNIMNPADSVDGDTTWHLPLPIIDSQATKVILGCTNPSSDSEDWISASSVSFDDDETEDEQWFKLEELSVQRIQGNLPFVFKPSIQRLTQRTVNYQRPLCVVKEPITVEVLMKNPFNIPLALRNLTLLWKFQAIDYNTDSDIVMPSITNEVNSGAKMNVANEIINTQTIPSLVVDSCQVKKVHLQLTPLETGQLQIIGVGYQLGISNAMQQTGETGENSNQLNNMWAQGKQYFKIQGPRLNNTKAEKASKSYGPDYRLESLIVPLMPRLQVNFSNFPDTMLCGEIQQVMVEFQNPGPFAVTELHVASSVPQMFSFGVPWTSTSSVSLSSGLSSLTTCTSSTYAYNEFIGKPVEPAEIPTLQRVSRIRLTSTPLSVSDLRSELAAGASCRIPLWIRAPDQPGKHKIDFLFYYESSETNKKMKHRVLRHAAEIQVNNSISVEAVAIRSHSKLGSDDVISLAVAMEVENTNEVVEPNPVEITIVQISSASKYWLLQPMSTTSSQEIQVNPRETAHLCFRALNTHHQISREINDSVMFSNISLGDREIDSSSTPCSDFCHRSLVSFPPVFEESLNRLSSTAEVSNNVETYEGMDAALHVRLTLIVLWKATLVNGSGAQLTVMGQHHLFINTINTLVSTAPEIKQVDEKPFRIIPDPERPLPPPRPYPSAVVLTQLVQCTVLHPHQVEHDFNVNRTCPIYVTLVVYNCSQLTLHVVVDTSKTSESLPLPKGPLGHQPSGYLATYQAAIATTFAWVGPTLTCVSPLLPKETQRVRLRACFFTPGTYNVGNVYVGVRRLATPEENLTQQRPCPTSLILVKSPSVT